MTVSEILQAIEKGSSQAADDLLPLVYEELRRLAAAKLHNEEPGQTLEATALVHEAYLRLVDTEKAKHWESRRHFFAAAAESMRRILIERARRKQRLKHGGELSRVDFDSVFPATDARPEMLLAMDEALSKLAAEDPAKAEFVRLRYFTGCTLKEAATALGISVATAKRNWVYARAWLYEELCKD